MKGALVALAFAVAVIAAGIAFDFFSPRTCQAGSPPGPRIGGAILIAGCP